MSEDYAKFRKKTSVIVFLTPDVLSENQEIQQSRTTRVAPELVGRLSGMGTAGSFRKSLEESGTRLVIPDRANLKRRIRHGKEAYKLATMSSNAAIVGSDFRRVATRGDNCREIIFPHSALSLPSRSSSNLVERGP